MFGLDPAANCDLREAGRRALRGRRHAGAVRPRRDADGDLGEGARRLLHRSGRGGDRRGERGEGRLFTAEDFASYKVRELEPVTCSYRGYEIISSPPPSSGGRHHLRDPERARGLSARRAGLRLGARPCTDGRGDAARLRRPQQLARRPGLRRQPGRAADRQGLCRGDPRHDRPYRAGGVGRADAGAGAARRHGRRRTTRSSTPRGTPSPSPTRSTAASAPASSPTAPACCSTTRWTTSPPSPARRTCTGWCRARRTRSRRASAALAR